MALLIADGFDAYSAVDELLDRWHKRASSMGFDATGGRWGGGAIFSTSSTSFLMSHVFPVDATRGTPANPLHAAFHYKASDSSDIAPLLRFQSRDGENVELVMDDATGQLAWTYQGSTTVVTPYSSISVTDGGWHHIEAAFAADDVSGFAKIWIDDSLEVDFSGDTAANSAGDILNVLVYTYDTVRVDFYDDLVVWDEAGSGLVTAGPLGIHRIGLVTPNGDGNSTQLAATGTGTTNADRVDDFPADDDTTYVESGTTGEKDLYTHTALGFTPNSIHGVITSARVVNPDLGTINFKALARSGTTEAYGSRGLIYVPHAYQIKQDFFDQDPDTLAAWTEAGVNAAEFGLEVG